MQFNKTTQLKKEIFRTGDYIKHFKPEDKKNPFRKIYAQKKNDTINLINSISGNKKILDVGGGMGRLSLVLSTYKQNQVVLADISIDMLLMAKSNSDHTKNFNCINNDAHFLPFKEHSFDFVVGLDLFCHLLEPSKVLSEFHRVLKPDGTLIMDSTNSNPFWTLFYPRYLSKNPLKWIKVFKFKGVLPGWEGIVNHYDEPSFNAYLNQSGFDILQRIHYGPFICPKWHLAVAKKVI